MRLWIDDVRPAPEGYEWCKSVADAVHIICNVEWYRAYKYGDKIFCIAIEDKTYTEEHEQLINYNKSLEEYAKWLRQEHNNSTIVIKKIFYKTAKLSSAEIERVEGNGWEVFDIDKIYPLFNTNFNIENNILNDYIKHVQDVFSACHTIEKPNKNESSIDFIKWESYFNNSIVPHLNKNGYQVGVWKAGQYPYICLVITKLGFSESICVIVTPKNRIFLSRQTASVLSPFPISLNSLTTYL